MKSRVTLASLLFKDLVTKHTTVEMSDQGFSFQRNCDAASVGK